MILTVLEGVVAFLLLLGMTRLGLFVRQHSTVTVVTNRGTETAYSSSRGTRLEYSDTRVSIKRPFRRVHAFKGNLRCFIHTRYSSDEDQCLMRMQPRHAKKVTDAFDNERMLAAAYKELAS